MGEDKTVISQRIKYLICFSAPIFIGLAAAYASGTLKFLPNLLGKSSSSGFWGLSLVSMYLSNHFKVLCGLNYFVEQYAKYISLALMMLVWVSCFKRAPLNSIMLIFNAFFFLAPRFGVQYLVWVIPFAVIAKDPMLVPYTILSSMLITLWYAPVVIMNDPAVHYHLIGWLNFARNFFSVLTWMVTGIWAWRLLRR